MPLHAIHDETDVLASQARLLGSAEFSLRLPSQSSLRFALALRFCLP